MNFLTTIALLCLAPATKYYNFPRTQIEVHNCQVQYIQCVLEKTKKDRFSTYDQALLKCVTEIKPE